MRTEHNLNLLLLGAVLATMTIACCSCQAIDKCFGGGSEEHASCGKCGSTSCSASCDGGHAAGDKPVHSCTLSAQARTERAVKVKEQVFSKAVATNELSDGYAFIFREPADFAAQLEEVAAYERKCCATFTWTVLSREGEQELRVTGGDAKAEIGSGLRKLGWLQ